MRQVSIIGTGYTPVGEHWDQSIRSLAAKAVLNALEDAKIQTVDAIYVGNAYGGTVSEQSQLAPLVADYTNLVGVEAYTIEAGDASGAAALRTGYMAVASGLAETVIVVGAEKMTDAIASSRVKSRSVSLDADYETAHGATLTSMAALLMQRYMYEYQVDLASFEGFSINAHMNGSKNPNAMFRNKIRVGAFAKAPMVSSPVNLFDGAPDADGAAAVVLTSRENARSYTAHPVHITGSAVAVDTLALQERQNFLSLDAVAKSFQKAFEQAGITPEDVDVLELHDAFTILTTLSLEAGGFAERGQGWQYAQNDGEAIGLAGKLPISTFGGLKSRGNPVGATGIYQAVEAYQQLTGKAEANQVNGAKTAVIQNVGGIGSTAITHVLQVD